MSDNNHVDQVGGQHYQAGAALQHWDYMEKYDIDYLTATATKYIMRWRKKGTPKLDLGKAASYVEKALKCREPQPGCNPHRLTARRLMPFTEVSAMLRDAQVHMLDRPWVRRLLISGTKEDFELVLVQLRAAEAAV